VHKNVQRFLNEKFINAMDVELMAEFLQRHPGVFGEVALTLRPENVYKERAQILMVLTSLNSPGAEVALEELHRIATIAKDPAFGALRKRAETHGIDIVPRDARLSSLDMRCITMRAFLRHPNLFGEAEDWWALERHTAVAEYLATDGFEVFTDEQSRKQFEEAAAELYDERYREPYCRARWYEADGKVHVVITHGVLPVTTLRIDAGHEECLTFREAKQDILIFDPEDGRLQVGARGLEEKIRLRDLFAEMILGDAYLFHAREARHLYTLDRVWREGRKFRLVAPSIDIADQRITDIEVRDGDNDKGWRVRVHDPEDAIRRYFETTHEEDFGGAEIIGLTVRLGIFVNGKLRRKTVRIKPPSTASFARSTGESIVLRFLQVNGFCRGYFAQLLAC
jgi:hypothetical protein